MDVMEKRPYIHSWERLAEVVTAARSDARLSQAQLADRARVDVGFVRELEAGHPRAETPLIVTVLHTLGLSPRAVPVSTPWAFNDSGALRSDVRPPVQRQH